jgi:hypothetical protein
MSRAVVSDSSLLLPDAATAGDLTTYLARARRYDPDGAARLVAAGGALAVYVSPVHGVGAPTALGLRVLPLARPADVDTTVTLSALADRLARLAEQGGGIDRPGPVELPLPPTQATGASWAGIAPPRTGWVAVGSVPGRDLVAAARSDPADVVASAPGPAGVPEGAAFAAHALGFVVPEEPVPMYRVGRWHRLTMTRGHVLTRSPLL